MTQERIDAANDAYNGADAVLEFVTMSDTELSGRAEEGRTAEEVAYDGHAPFFERIRAWAETKGFTVEALVDNGDVVGANEPEYEEHLAGEDTDAAGWYRAFERVTRESFPDAQVLLTQGNHDIADLMGATFDEARADAGADVPWFYPREEDDYVGNFHTTISGIDFIGLDYNGAETFGYAGQRTGYQDFLRETLSEIAARPDYDPAKPIFVNIHSGYEGTSLGGPFHADYDLAGPDLPEILGDFSQVVLGSAHTHFSSAPETSIYQKGFTVYENASMNYVYQDVPGDFLGGGYMEGNQGDPEAGTPWMRSANFVTVLDSGETVIRRYDVTRDRWIGMPWVVDTTNGTDGFTYRDEDRSTVAPWWEGAAITASEREETALVLGFDHAKDDELVSHYRVEIADEAGEPVSFTANQVPDFGGNEPREVEGSFRALSRYDMSPDDMGFAIGGLEPDTAYRVTVTAFDDFENASEPLEGVVRTAGDDETPGEDESGDADADAGESGDDGSGDAEDADAAAEGDADESGAGAEDGAEPGDDDAAADGSEGDAGADEGANADGNGAGDAGGEGAADDGSLAPTGGSAGLTVAAAVGTALLGAGAILALTRRRAVRAGR